LAEKYYIKKLWHNYIRMNLTWQEVITFLPKKYAEVVEEVILEKEKEKLDRIRKGREDEEMKEKETREREIKKFTNEFINIETNFHTLK